MNLYIVRPDAPMRWGDYASILASGMTSYRESPEEPLQLERTGPFIPPITFPGLDSIVVTEVFRKELEASGLLGLRFRPLIKKHIVLLRWDKWDWSAADPRMYPREGEPENYIDGRKHSPEAANRLGDLWELTLEEGAEGHHILKDPGPPKQYDFVVASRKGNADLFRASHTLYVIATERAKRWLEGTAGEWLAFEPVLTR